MADASTAISGKLVILRAVTGAFHRPTMPPRLPVTQDEIAAEVVGVAVRTPAIPAKRPLGRAMIVDRIARMTGLAFA